MTTLMRRFSIGRKIALGFALGPIALIVIGLVAFATTNRLLDAQRSVLTSYTIRDALHRVEIDLTMAESQQRGFLLTGKASYLPTYRAARDRIDPRLNDLAAAVAGDADLEARVAVMRPLIDQRVAMFDARIARRQAQGARGSLDSVASGGGEDVMNRIRAMLGGALTEQEQLEVNRFAENARVAHLALGAIAYGTAALVVLLILAGAWFARHVSAPLEEAVAALTSASAEILAGTTQQAAGVQEQAAAVTETVSTVEEISLTTESANDRAKAVAESALRAAENGVAGVRAVEDTVSVMADVKARTESIANSILALAEQAQAIGEIIAVVNDVADQTNILAFNAAIEASRAGEHGRGFGVVAAEIKSLAEQSKKATVQVRQILGDIQRATNGAVIATEHGAKTVDEALGAVQQAEAAIRTLTEIVAESARSATQISASANQASIGMSQIQRAMRDISETTSQNLASTRQAEQAARGLDGVGMRLAELLRGATV
jgi:methyl-accepting chemotaxis protein